MSRSRKGGKSPGYDFWSRRPGSGSGHGPSAKDITHRAERQEAKKAAQEDLCKCEEPDTLPYEAYCFKCHKDTATILKKFK